MLAAAPLTPGTSPRLPSLARCHRTWSPKPTRSGHWRSTRFVVTSLALQKLAAAGQDAEVTLLRVECKKGSLSSVASGLHAWHAFSTDILGYSESETLPPGASAGDCWLVGLGFLFRGSRPKDRFSSVGIPSMFWDFGSLQQKHRESAGPWL